MQMQLFKEIKVFQHVITHHFNHTHQPLQQMCVLVPWMMVL